MIGTGKFNIQGISSEGLYRNRQVINSIFCLSKDCVAPVPKPYCCFSHDEAHILHCMNDLFQIQDGAICEEASGLCAAGTATANGHQHHKAAKTDIKCGQIGKVMPMICFHFSLSFV